MAYLNFPFHLLPKIIFIGLLFIISSWKTTSAMHSSAATQEELLRIYTEELHIDFFTASGYIKDMLSFLHALIYPIQNTTNIQTHLLRALIKGAYPRRESAILRSQFFTEELQSFTHKLIKSKQKLYYEQAETFVFQTLINFYSTLKYR
jgi:hypothetical protein